MKGLRLTFTEQMTYIFPTQGGFTVFTVDVSHGVQTCEEYPLLRWPAADIHPEGTGSGGQRSGRAMEVELMSFV